MSQYFTLLTPEWYRSGCYKPAYGKEKDFTLFNSNDRYQQESFLI